MITFTCGACGRTIAAEVGSGSTVSCPYCKQVVTVPMDPQGNPVAPPTTPQPLGYASQPSLRQGLAVAAMIVGLIGLMGLLVGCGAALGPVAVVLGIVALVKARRRPREYGGKGFAIAGIATGSVGILAGVLFVAFLMIPPMTRATDLAKRSVCSANLAGLGKCLMIYANQHRGAFPPSLDVLVSMNLVQPDVFVCPADTGQSGGAANSSFYGPPATVSSYIYIPGQNDRVDPRNVLVYEKPGIHDDDGGNVLFADMGAKWISPYSRVEQLVAETRARLASQPPPVSSLPSADGLPAEQPPQVPAD